MDRLENTRYGWHCLLPNQFYVFQFRISVLSDQLDIHIHLVDLKFSFCSFMMYVYMKMEFYESIRTDYNWYTHVMVSIHF
jgi:hypothetical protein